MIRLKIRFFILMSLLFSPGHAATTLNEAVERLVDGLLTASQGTVVRVGETGLLYIEFEGRGGINKGSTVEVVRQGAPIQVNDRIVGYEENSIGLAEIVNLFQDKGLARLVSGSSTEPLPGDRVYAERGIGERAVVVPLSYRQEITEFSLSLQEKLVTALVQRGLPVVERSQLERVLQEQQLTYSGLFDIGSAQEVGRLVGAQMMLLGSINDQGNSIAINGRLVDLNTASIVAATEVDLLKTSLIEAGLAEVIPQANFRSVTTKSQEKKTSGVTTGAQNQTVFENDILRVRFQSLYRTADKRKVKLTLLFENISENRIYLGVPYPVGRNVGFVDNKGKSWTLSADPMGIAQVHSHNLGQDGARMVKNQKAVVLFSFESKEQSQGTIFNFSASIRAGVVSGDEFNQFLFSIGLLNLQLSE